MSTKEEILAFKQALRFYVQNSLPLMLAAMLVWLFGVLVFIPIAASIGENAELVCTLIILVAFTFFMSKSIISLKNLIDAFSVFPARKILIKRELTKENAIVVSKQILYMLLIVFLYLLYFPLLVAINPAFNGIVLILTIILVFYIALKAIHASHEAIAKWLYS